MNPVVWGSGVWNDASCLHDQANPGEPSFMGYRIFDAKTLFQTYSMVNGKTIKAGLTTALDKMMLQFDGQAHDALNDATNTAKIFVELSKKFLTK